MLGFGFGKGLFTFFDPGYGPPKGPLFFEPPIGGGWLLVGLVLGSWRNLQFPWAKFLQSAPNLHGLGPPYIDILIILKSRVINIELTITHESNEFRTEKLTT